MQDGTQDPDHAGAATRRRSFHVLYVDADADGRETVVAELEPTYPVTTANSLVEGCGAIDRTTDCVVVAEDLAGEAGGRFLAHLKTTWPDLPVVLFGATPGSTVLEDLLAVNTSGVVSRTDDDGSPTAQDLDRLRRRLDDHYEESISDVRETVLEIARSLMSAAPDEIDVEIEWALKLIGRRLDADRCLIFEYDEDVLERTHAWSADDASSTEPKRVPVDSFPGFETSISSFDPYAVPAKSMGPPDIDIPDGFVGSIRSAQSTDSAGANGEDRADHPYLDERDLQSLLAVPIVVEWELEGVLAIEQEARRPWPRSLQQQVKTLGELVGYTIDRDRRRRELAAQNDRLERFTSVVSHDLRNPLNVLSGYAELVAETGDTTHIDGVIEAADRMETMIEDLLTLAREGADVDETREISLEDVVWDAWSGVDTGDARLETGDLGTVECDPGRLRQAFENLFRNAIEHGSSDDPGAGDGDEPTVTVRVERTDDGFAVEDDGPGIPPDERDEVFREGYTGGDGTGLGLSIVRTVAEAHGWSIRACDGDLGGARFEFTTES